MTNRELYKRSELFIKSLLKKELPEDAEIFLFGSRARKDNGKYSDIDIGIISKKMDKKTLIKITERIKA